MFVVQKGEVQHVLQTNSYPFLIFFLFFPSLLAPLYKLLKSKLPQTCPRRSLSPLNVLPRISSAGPCNKLKA